jgi:hypothetical protein
MTRAEKEHYVSGTTVLAGPTASNRIGVFTDGTWTGGAGYLLVRGTSLKYA